MEIYTILFTLLFTQLNTSIICEICLILLALLSNITVFFITDKKTINIISKKVVYSTYQDENKNPSGICIGKWFLGYLQTSEYNGGKFHILTFDAKFHKVYTTEQMQMDNKKVVENDTSVNDTNIWYWFRHGSYEYIRYIKRQIKNWTKCREEQSAIVSDIVSHYNEHKTGTFFISGEPGVGKSTILKLLGNRFQQCHLCKQFRPCEPGDTIDFLYHTIEPTEKMPLIILFDEIDRIIDKVHNNNIDPHKKISIEIQDTTSYNTFFDDIDDKMYPYLIVLLTSNYSKEEIDEIYHPCYLRKGRVHMHFVLNSTESTITDIEPDISQKPCASMYGPHYYPEHELMNGCLDPVYNCIYYVFNDGAHTISSADTVDLFGDAESAEDAVDDFCSLIEDHFINEWGGIYPGTSDFAFQEQKIAHFEKDCNTNGYILEKHHVIVDVKNRKMSVIHSWYM